MRVDLKLIAGMIEPGSRVLDIGSGDGTLIEHLFRTRGCDARGIEIDMAEVTRAVAHGLPVMHGDADHDLAQYPDGAFDYVVLTRTLQAVERPRTVLRQMLRIGTRALVSFPNFGHWQVRLQLLRTGRMPNTATWSRPWYETPNIHPCTILDFRELCAEEGYAVERWLAIDEAGRKSPWRRSLWLANLFGEQAMFLMRRAAPDDPKGKDFFSEEKKALNFLFGDLAGMPRHPRPRRRIPPICARLGKPVLGQPLQARPVLHRRRPACVAGQDQPVQGRPAAGLQIGLVPHDPQSRSSQGNAQDLIRARLAARSGA